MIYTKLSKRLSSIFLAFALLPLAGCGAGTTDTAMEKGLANNNNQAERGQKTGGREVSLGERFKLESKEKVSIKDTKLILQLIGVRRSWLADGKGEFVDAEIIITLDGREQKQWMKIGDEVIASDYLVKLWGADPFGKTNAELIVTRR